ncbi:MAG: 6-bladed beta-propeller [Dehalococcoidia bacterium]
MTTANIVGNGKYTYEVHTDWAKLPEGWAMPAAAVYGDSQDRIYCFNRDPDHQIVIFDKDGNYLSHWSNLDIAFPHAIIIDKNDHVWLVDRNNCQIHEYTNDGQLLRSLGQRGYRSDTGVDNSTFDSNGWRNVTRGAEPFNLPAGIALNDAGEVFIADGYANARLHKFSPDFQLIKSVGEPGTGPGEFNLPHGAWIDRRGRLLITDRENDRIQVFNQDLEYITTFPSPLIGAAVIYIDDEDIVYVAEHNGGMVSILDLDGNRLAQWGSMTHRSCHGIWVDSNKDLYVVEPFEGSQGRTVVKFVRKG